MIKNRTICIVIPFIKDLEPNNATNIRIAGYSQELVNTKVDFLFFSENKPSYIDDDHYVNLSINSKLSKIFLICNLISKIRILRPIYFILSNFLILYLSRNIDLSLFSGNSILWSHQDNVFVNFLKNVYHVNYIYDVHGLFCIQHEYKYNLSFIKRFFFNLYEMHEKMVLANADYINVVSNEMKYFLISKNPNVTYLLAPDGLSKSYQFYKSIEPNKLLFNDLRIAKEKKILLFAGSFKEIGGVDWLLKVYINSIYLNDKFNLVLIGDGPLKTKIINTINNCSIKNIIYYPQQSYEMLISYLKCADIIVCPDNPTNIYNQITPHIKLYEAIACDRKIIATDFSVNRQLFPENLFKIVYFEYTKKSFENGIKHLLSTEDKEYDSKQIEVIKSFEYNSRCRQYINNNFSYD